MSELTNQPPPVDSLDTPIHRATIDKLPIETLDNWLTSIRERRLVIVHKLQDAKDAKRRAYISDVVEKYGKLYQRVENALSKLDDHIETAEKQLNKLRALALEIEDDDLPKGD